MYSLMYVRLVSVRMLASYILSRLVGPCDCLKDTTLHTVVYKFQSDREVHVPPAPPPQVLSIIIP